MCRFNSHTFSSGIAFRIASRCASTPSHTFMQTIQMCESVCVQDCVGAAASSLESSIKWGDGFLIMYSVTDRSSFEAVSRLKRLIDHVKQTLGKANQDCCE